LAPGHIGDRSTAVAMNDSHSIRQRCTSDPQPTLALSRIKPLWVGHYPDLLCVEILRLVHETERQATSDPFETDLIFTARTLVENGEPKVAMFKLHEVIGGRQYSS
jgi:hypothetical protein